MDPDPYKITREKLTKLCSNIRLVSFFGIYNRKECKHQTYLEIPMYFLTPKRITK